MTANRLAKHVNYSLGSRGTPFNAFLFFAESSPSCERINEKTEEQVTFMCIIYVGAYIRPVFVDQVY